MHYMALTLKTGNSIAALLRLQRSGSNAGGTVNLVAALTIIAQLANKFNLHKAIGELACLVSPEWRERESTVVKQVERRKSFFQCP
jgi:hypothetical protein